MKGVTSRFRAPDARNLRLLAAALLVCVVGAAQAGIVWQTNGVGVCVAPNTQETPSVVSLGAGGAIIVWADARDLDYDIYAQRLDGDGNEAWSSGGVMVCGQPYDQQFPVACEDGAGGVIVVWQDGRQGDDGMEIYAQRIHADGTTAWLPDGLPVCVHESGLLDPPTAFSHVIASDGSGGAVVAWRDTRADPEEGNTEIYVQRINAVGAPEWAVNGLRILGFDLEKWPTRNPIVCSDGFGGAVVVWQDGRNAAITGNDLYAQRVTAAGGAAWAANGVVVCDALSEQGYPDSLHAGGGSAVVVWEDKRSGNYDVYAQRLDPATGAPQWGANGLLVCDSANDQRTPRVVSDGTGGTIIAWTDKRSDPAYTDIYAQRLDGSGLPQWTSQGTPVCTAAGSQTRVRMCSASGSAILTWMDTRNETAPAFYDIYGQMIDAAGSTKWDAQGVPVGAVTGTNQRMQQAAGDLAGNVYTVWEDDRSGGWDIYAQRLGPWTPVSDIPDAKSRPEGTAVCLPARVVTAVFPGFFYVEETQRYSGIRVVWPEVVDVGDLVAVSGTVQTECERSIEASLVMPAGSDDVPLPLGITAAALGGNGVGGQGCSNVGLLVRTWGRVDTKVTGPPEYLVVTDGSSDVRVYGSSTADEDDYVIVTGICSCESGPSGPVPAILATDVRVISP